MTNEEQKLFHLAPYVQDMLAKLPETSNGSQHVIFKVNREGIIEEVETTVSWGRKAFMPIWFSSSCLIVSVEIYSK